MRRMFQIAAAALLAAAPMAGRAADHAEAPLVEADQAADIADVYAFLDPNDNAKVILAFDVHGFVVPGENGNLGSFDSDVLFRFNIENTGDAAADKYIFVNFSKQTSRATPQTATITIPGRDLASTVRFTAPTTVSSPTADVAPSPTVTTDPASGISFFAGLTDDPFFFDIPAFNRFVGSVLAGAPNGALLSRGRDTFAGYNVSMIALSVPADLLKGTAGSVLGVSASTLRAGATSRTGRSIAALPMRAVRALPGVDPTAMLFAGAPFTQIDRMGIPAVNTALIPFPRKNEYNKATPVDDAAGKFAGDIVATLKALGTDDAHIGILASVAVANGDMLRLDTAVNNSGPQGGTSAGAGFPNGRRPTDDVIDTILFLVTNGALTTGDNVGANDSTFRDEFPFFAAPHQPQPSGTIDDDTRN